MDVLKNLPGSAVQEDKNPARSSYHDPTVAKARMKYDQYMRKGGTLECDHPDMLGTEGQMGDMEMGEGPGDMD